ncbi:MAG: ribosomal protein S11 RpsK [uncultured bacterium]|nr:MAG: ribosomal protein S11 RpsK [uncultured bacterium]
MAKNVKLNKKKKVNKKVTLGKMFIQATFNNTLVSITDSNGGVLSWSSAGSLGFKGARKATPYAAQLAAQAAIEKAKKFGLETIEVFISGIGSGRESAVRSLLGSGITVTSIKDVTPIPHNGCRPKKVRRV